MTTAPTPLPRSSVLVTPHSAGKRDDGGSHRRVNHSAGNISQSVTSAAGTTSRGGSAKGGGGMVDSYLSSFNNVSVGNTHLEDYEDDDDDDVFADNNNHVTHPSAPSGPPRLQPKKGPAPPVPMPRSQQQQQRPPSLGGKPEPQDLRQLPGLSIVTWEEFLQTPSVLCGLFQLDRNDFIRYNPEQVNVFFHDSRMDQPTLGSPSGDGLSWTIFIDNYNHLRSVRTWLTERVTIILLQLLKGKGKGKAACLVAINPLNRTVGDELNDSFSTAIDAFLHHRNFCIEVNLNSCVQKWCSTVLQMSCRVQGGRLVVTNAEESVSCCRVTNVPFCILCFPVWGCQKLAYKFKRRAHYEDCFLYFKAEDLALCTKSPKLMQYAEKNNANHINGGREEKRTDVTSEGKRKPWIKKNRKAVTTATQTVDSGDDQPSGHLDIEEVEDNLEEAEDDEEEEDEDRRGRELRGVSSVSASTNTERAQLQHHTPNGFPGLRPAHSITARLQGGSEGHMVHPLAGSKSNLLSVSSTSSCSTTLPAHDRTTLSSADPTPREGATMLPVGALGTLQHRPGYVEEEEDEAGAEGDDSLSLYTPRTPRVRLSPEGEDLRAAGLGPVSTLPSVGSDDEHGAYRLQPETPSPRPDTPFHRRLPAQARKLQPRPSLMRDVIVDENEDQLGGGGGGGAVLESPSPPPGDGRVHLTGSTDTHLPPEPESKQRKKRISKVMRDMTGRGGGGPPAWRGEDGGRDNQAFVKDEPREEDYSSQQARPVKVKYTPITGLKEKNQAFPYTSELMDFVGENSKKKTSYSPEKQAAKDKDKDKDKPNKPKAKKSSVQRKAEDMLFAPRFLLTEDLNNRNCLSDNDIMEDDFGDMEPDNVMSDVEGVASPRLIPVKKTKSTVSVDSVNTPRSEVDTDWEITDCELEEPRRRGGPSILPGARGAQQLRANSANRNSRESSGDSRRRGGLQNDSRRRYIALNSLRRKANQLARQSELRKQQKRPDSSGSARLEVQDV